MPRFDGCEDTGVRTAPEEDRASDDHDQKAGELDHRGDDVGGRRLCHASEVDRGEQEQDAGHRCRWRKPRDEPSHVAAKRDRHRCQGKNARGEDHPPDQQRQRRAPERLLGEERLARASGEATPELGVGEGGQAGHDERDAEGSPARAPRHPCHLPDERIDAGAEDVPDAVEDERPKT